MADYIRKLQAIFLIFMQGTVAADAKPLALTGKMGFLSEWDVSGQLAQNDQGEFSGSLNMTHTGLCTHDGPLQKRANIRLVVASRVKATIAIDGADCAFTAAGAGTPDGVLTCPNSTAIPLTLNLQK